jgi:hypothetical protein
MDSIIVDPGASPVDVIVPLEDVVVEPKDAVIVREYSRQWF